MFKFVLGVLAAVTTSIAGAQASDGATTEAVAAATPASAAKPSPADPILGMLKETTDSAEKATEFCRLDASKLPRNSIVVIIRKTTCTVKYGGSKYERFEVLHGGKKRLIPVDSVFLRPEQAARLGTIDPAQIEASMNEWTLTSLVARKQELDKAIKALDATSKFGVALLNASIYDVSEHTEGTGFRATVYNSTKKTIKYVTFTVTGLNAVGDPVHGGWRGNASQVLRGIGPIEPGETASYSKEYMWMTDIVQSFRVSSIKLEYTDGSSKVVSDVKKIRISPDDLEMLTPGEN